VFLALREIRRSRLRFALLAGAVGLLVFLILFLQTLLGALLTFFVGGLENQSAQVLVYGEDARRTVAASVVTPEQVANVSDVAGVASAAPLGQADFTVDAGGELQDASLFGHELDGPGEPLEIVDGRRPAGDGEAVASDVDADRGFAVGQSVVIQPAGVEVEVVGLAREIRFNVLPTLFVSYGTYEDALAGRDPDVPAVLPSLVAVQPQDGTSPHELATRIDETVEGVEALARETAVAEIPGVEQIRTSFAILVGLAFIVVGLVTGVFFLILTLQKRDALTLLRAVGADARDLVAVIVVQVVTVVGVGVLIGTGLTGLAGLASTEEFPIALRPGLAAATGTAILVLGLLVSGAAIRRVLRIDPASATGRADTGVMV
jgi:putative ABC transport system permease protein